MSSDTFAPVPLSDRKEEKPLRLVLLGKTGTGKSSFCNTLIEEPEFDVDFSASSCSSKCQVKGNDEIILIDTPGFFDTRQEQANLKAEIVKSITECSPGPHAFLILLKVEKYTEHENQVIVEIEKLFSKEAFEYAVLVFSHGDQLPSRKSIKDFVKGNEALQQLLDKCDGRCVVVDNKYWNNNLPESYRSNQFQKTELLKTINEMAQREGRCYTNEMLQAVEGNIQEETERTGSREEAKKNFISTFLKKIRSIDTEDLKAAFVGQPAKVKLVLAVAFGLAAVAGIAVGAVVGGAAGAVVGGAAGAVAGGAAVVVAVKRAVAATRKHPAGYERLETDSVDQVAANTAEPRGGASGGAGGAARRRPRPRV